MWPPGSCPSSNPSGGTCPRPALLPARLPPFPAAMDGLLPTALAVFVALPQKEGGFCLTGELELSGGSTGAASASQH